MDPYGRGRRVVLVSALGVLIPCGVLVFLWKDVVVRYHFFRLNDPAYFLESLEFSRETLRSQGLQLFLQSRAGKQALIKAFLVEAHNPTPDDAGLSSSVDSALHNKDPIGDLDLADVETREECGDRVVYGLVYDPFDGLVVWRKDCSGEGPGSALFSPAGSRMRKLHESLAVMAGEEIYLPEFSNLLFRVFDATRLRDVSGFPWFHTAQPRGNACMIQRSRDTKETISALRRKLKDKNPYTRYWSARTIERFGSDAKAITAELKDAVKDQDAQVRKAAEAALRAIEGEM